MNILNVLRFTPFSGGGIVMHLRSLGQIAESCGLKLFLSFSEKRDWHSELETVAEILIIPEIENPIMSGFPVVLRKICKQHNIDVVHFHFYFSMPCALALSFQTWNLPLVYHWHNPPLALIDFFTPVGKFKGKIKRKISGLIARFTDWRVIDKHISMSQEISNLLVKNGWTKENKIDYVPNGVTTNFNNKRFPKEHNSNKIIIGTVSNFRPQKDLPTLVKAFKILVKNNLDTELWLVGDGETRPVIERLTTELGLESRVRFMGTVSDPSIMYNQFDIFVLSSHFEGHPLVILEAMSNGLPVVATRVSSIPETIEHNVNGLLVNHQDSEDLAEALLKLITDQHLRNKLGKEAKKTADRQPTVDDWAKRIILVYEECLAKS